MELWMFHQKYGQKKNWYFQNGPDKFQMLKQCKVKKTILILNFQSLVMIQRLIS